MNLKEILLASNEDLVSYFRNTHSDDFQSELLSRLAQGEKAIVGEAIGLTAVENLCCCGNCWKYEARECSQYLDYMKTGQYPTANHYCDKWESDSIARQERMLK